MGPVSARDNGLLLLFLLRNNITPGHESSRKLYYTRIRILLGIILHPNMNLLGNYITPVHESSALRHYKYRTNHDSSVSLKHDASCLIIIYYVIVNL